MSYHQDWLMRQIEAITAMLGYLLSGKANTVTIDEAEHTNGKENELYLLLQTLTRQGKICEAENVLFEALEQPSQLVLDAATRFYADLNGFSDQTLIGCNFTREEIMEGLQEVCRVFDIPI